MATDSRLRVLFICPGYGTIPRGVEVFLQQLLDRLDAQRFDVSVLGRVERQHDRFRFAKGRTVDRTVFDSLFSFRLATFLRYFRIGSSSEMESMVFSFCALPFLVRNRFDIIMPFGGYWGYLAAALTGKGARVLAVGHAGPVISELKLADAFVALTDHDASEARKIVPSKPVFVIPNGVDCKLFYPGTKTSDLKSTILCAAAFTSNKGHELLFNAVELLDRSIRLLCVGPGKVPERLSLHPLCRSHRVEFRSASHEDMPDIYRRADIFTLPAPGESFGIVFLEALASGLNVVAADAPRQRSVIGPSGFYCNVTDREEYAATLLRALHTPQREKNIDRARLFDWKRIAATYQEVFIQLS